jgi:hypothetical protein
MLLVLVARLTGALRDFSLLSHVTTPWQREASQLLDSILLALLVTLLTAVHPCSDLLHTSKKQNLICSESPLTTISFARQSHKANTELRHTCAIVHLGAQSIPLTVKDRLSQS